MIITKDTRGVLPLPADFTTHVLILDFRILRPEYQEAKWQLWKAEGGFGCEPFTRGQAVFATCLHYKEVARWSRSNFIGEASPELIKEVLG